jgi:gamma-glutamylcyclotransferase (GGCT)/AIG2-like uncharacterized protein YtfP
MNYHDEPFGLFVYGTLLWPDRRKELLGHDVAASPARLDGYRVIAGRYLFVVREAGAITRGLILRGIAGAGLGILDRYEDTPRLYTRELIDVQGEHGKSERCWIYLPADELLRTWKRPP